MNRFALSLAITGLLITLISTPTAFAEETDEMSSFVLTIVCTVYGESTPDFVESAFGLDGSDCDISTEYMMAAEDDDYASTKVVLSSGSHLPTCQNDDSCIVPSTVEVYAGETVVWVNEDNLIHTVTSNDPHPDGILDDFVEPGQEYEFTFETVGEYPYRCVVHPWATGVVIVKPDTSPTDGDRAIDVMNEIIEQHNIRSDAILRYITETAGRLYPDVAIFALDPDRVVVAHSTDRQYIGLNVLPVLERASIPIDTLTELLDTQPGGVWISYPVPDPTNPSNILFYERGWFRTSGDYTFGVRYSISDEAFVQRIVHELVRVHELNPDNTLDVVNSLMTTDVNYPFILNQTDNTILAHGADSSRVGSIAVSLTESNKPRDVIIHELQNNEGTWVEYTFLNPSTGTEQIKRTWLVLYDGLIFGSGYYIDDAMMMP